MQAGAAAGRGPVPDRGVVPVERHAGRRQLVADPVGEGDLGVADTPGAGGVLDAASGNGLSGWNRSGTTASGKPFMLVSAVWTVPKTRQKDHMPEM